MVKDPFQKSGGACKAPITRKLLELFKMLMLNEQLEQKRRKKNMNELKKKKRMLLLNWRLLNSKLR